MLGLRIFVGKLVKSSFDRSYPADLEGIQLVFEDVVDF